MTDHDDARAMLNTAEEAESATLNPPLPRTFFITQASLITVICCAQVLPDNFSLLVTILGFMALVGVGIRRVFLRPGYGVVWLDGKGAFPYMMTMLLLVGIPAALVDSLDAPWIWLLAGALASAATLEMGHRYRKEVGSA